MAVPMNTRNSLVGTWKLTSVKFELTDTSESIDMYGPETLGFLILTAEGRFMVIETVRDRQPPQNDDDNAALFKSMIAHHFAVVQSRRRWTSLRRWVKAPPNQEFVTQNTVQQTDQSLHVKGAICGGLEFSPRGARRRHYRLRRDRLHCVPSAKPGLERARSAAQRCRGGNAA